MNPGEAEDRLRRMESVTDTALAHLDSKKLLEELLSRVRELLNADTATVLLLDRTGRQLVALAAQGIEEEVRQGVRVPVGLGFAGRVAARREPVMINRVDDTTVANRLLWERGLRTLLGVPLIAGGKLIGVLHVGVETQREFTDYDVRLLQLVGDRIALVTETQNSATEQAAAAALHRSLVPAALPEIAGLELGSRYVPGAATGVGGDWYDVFPLPGDRVGIVLGDVVGNGLPAAVVMGRLRSALRAYALDIDDPATVLDKLDHKASHFEDGAMATVSYAIVDPGRSRVRFALAGHLPPILALPGEEGGTVVDCPVGPPVGFHGGDAHGPGRTLNLPRGAVLCFYTDGLVERRGIPIDEGITRLARTVTAEAPDRVCAQVMSALVGNQPAQDDIAVLVLRRI